MFTNNRFKQGHSMSALMNKRVFAWSMPLAMCLGLFTQATSFACNDPTSQSSANEPSQPSELPEDIKMRQKELFKEEIKLLEKRLEQLKEKTAFTSEHIGIGKITRANRELFNTMRELLNTKRKLAALDSDLETKIALLKQEIFIVDRRVAFLRTLKENEEGRPGFTLSPSNIMALEREMLALKRELLATQARKQSQGRSVSKPHGKEEDGHSPSQKRTIQLESEEVVVNGSITAPPSGEQAYEVYRIDATRFDGPGVITVHLELGKGESGASFDLFPGNVTIPEGGKAQERVRNNHAVAYLHDVAPGEEGTIRYPFKDGVVVQLGATGNWPSPTNSRNTFRMTIKVQRVDDPDKLKPTKENRFYGAHKHDETNERGSAAEGGLSQGEDGGFDGGGGFFPGYTGTFESSGSGFARQEQVPTLIHLLQAHIRNTKPLPTQKEPSVTTRREAAWVLGQVGHIRTSATSTLTEVILDKDQSLKFRRSALNALAKGFVGKEKARKIKLAVEKTPHWKLSKQIQNGGFEQGNVGMITPGSGDLPAWDVYLGKVGSGAQGPHPREADGDMADLGARVPPGCIEQTLLTQPGKSYQINLQCRPGRNKILRITIGDFHRDVRLSRDHLVQKTFEFRTTPYLSTLSLSAVENAGFGPFVDNITVKAVP